MSLANGLVNSSMSIMTILLYRCHIFWLGDITGCSGPIFRASNEASPISLMNVCSQAVPGLVKFKQERERFLPQAMGRCLCVPPQLQLRQGLFLVSPVRPLASRITQASCCRGDRLRTLVPACVETPHSINNPSSSS